TDIVSAEAQPELANFQSLRYPTGLYVLEIRKIKARDSEVFQIFNRRRFFPVPSAQGRVRGLESRGDERGETAGLFLQLIEPLQVVDPVLIFFSDAKHHRRGCAHAKLVRCPMNIEPVIGKALQAGNLVANFIVENFCSAARNGIEPGVPEANDRVTN